MGLFDQEKIFVTTEEMFALHNGIAEVSGDPAIGLKLGTEERVERYDPIAIAALYTRSFRDALQRIVRYKQLTCPEEIRVAEDGNECAVQFVWLLSDRPEPATLLDVCFAWVVAIGRRGTGSLFNPKRVEFQRAQAHRKLYEAHFKCPITFGAPQNLLVFHSADVDRPFLTHNAELLGMVAPQLEAELTQQLAQKTLSEQVKGLLKRLLAGRRPELEDVARELRLSTRTLQRLLSAAGASFQRLMEDARREPRETLLAAFLARTQRNRVSPRLRGRQLVLPRLPSVGRHVAGRMARPPHPARATDGSAKIVCADVETIDDSSWLPRQEQSGLGRPFPTTEPLPLNLNRGTERPRALATVARKT